MFAPQAAALKPQLLNEPGLLASVTVVFYDYGLRRLGELLIAHNKLDHLVEFLAAVA